MTGEKGHTREQKLKEDYYFSDIYFNKYQLFSLSEQINLVYKYSKFFNEANILEIGKGNGFVSDFFKKAGYKYTTFDINKNLQPDIVGNILELSEHVSFSPDIILCSEVLEHIEYDFFESSLEQMSKVSKKFVIITIPEFKRFYGINFQIRFPKVKPFSFPFYLKSRYNKILASGHFWEINYSKETRRKNIELTIKKYFTIVEKGYFHTNPYHNYYVLKVQ